MNNPHAARELRILALSLNDWSDQWTNRQHLLSRLAADNTVLHSKGGWFSWELGTSAWRRTLFGARITQANNVYLDQCPWHLVRFPRFPVLDRLAQRHIVRRWNRWLARNGSGPRVLMVFHPDLFPYVRHIERDILVYHAYDLFQHTPGWNEQREKLQMALLRKANIVTASSDVIANSLQSLSSREVRVLPNGVDIRAYTETPGKAFDIPQDLRNIPRPRLGYVGSLVFTVDFALVAALAQGNRHWHFVFIGGKGGKFDERLEAAFAQCQALPNVHFLGPKPIHEVAAYSMNMDVNLMLYRISDGVWTQAGYPLKLHEYLAAAKPVVSANLPTVQPFAHVVRIATGAIDWQQAIEAALAHGGTGTPEARQAVAAQNTWGMRVNTLRTWIWDYLDTTARQR